MDRQTLKQMLERRSGRSITSAADCEWLALDFKSRVGESIGVNTLKRLLGFLNHDVATHHASTLDVVAHYLGYRKWGDVESLAVPSDFGHTPEVLNVDALAFDQTVNMAYRPDRTLKLRYEGESKFTIVASENSKLKVGDVVTIHQFALGHPLFVEDVVRDGISLGEYTAAKIDGITSIDVD